MRFRMTAWSLVSCLSVQIAVAASFPARLKKEFDKHAVCATVDFDDLEVNVEDGIVERSADDANRVRTGDRLELVDADVSLDGLDVELELRSPHTRSRTVDVELTFYRSIRGPNNELVNMDDFWKAVGYFSASCEAQRDNAG